MDAVRTEGLTRVFKANRGKRETRALEDLNLDIKEGELFGLLGPNGAGKTTVIKILATLLLPSSGRAEVLGHDVEKEAQKIRPYINMVAGGEVSGYGLLTVRENLWMFSQFYGMPGKEARARIDDLLSTLGLEEHADSKVRTLSTGEKQKMNVIRGFVTDPRLIFLDEPTLGLDVNSSRKIRAFIQNWVSSREGRTVLLTTHYMAEAEELCGRVAIIDRGRILACDTPDNLKRSLDRMTSYEIQISSIQEMGGLRNIEGVGGFASEPAEEGQRLRVQVEDEGVISDIVSLIVGRGAKIMSMSKREPTLEDVFISLVGRGLESK
jgi:ABC-2 type transport system ATP-binding protein